MARAAATPETREGQEIWKNQSPGSVVVRKFNHRGDLAKTEMVRGGRVVHLSHEERRMNQELAASPKLDPFSSGVMTPVRIVESAEDAREIASNPNLMTEDEMRSLVKGHPKTFEKRLSEIGNAITLQRLLAIAREEDATVKRVESILEQITSVSPGPHEVTSTTPSSSTGGQPRGVTPS